MVVVVVVVVVVVIVIVVVVAAAAAEGVEVHVHVPSHGPWAPHCTPARQHSPTILKVRIDVATAIWRMMECFGSLRSWLCGLKVWRRTQRVWLLRSSPKTCQRKWQVYYGPSAFFTDYEFSRRPVLEQGRHAKVRAAFISWWGMSSWPFQSHHRGKPSTLRKFHQTAISRKPTFSKNICISLLWSLHS